MRVSALRAQRVLPGGPPELPLPLLTRCVCACTSAGWRGGHGLWLPRSVCACAHAPSVDQAECVPVTATSLSRFLHLQNRANHSTCSWSCEEGQDVKFSKPCHMAWHVQGGC